MENNRSPYGIVNALKGKCITIDKFALEKNEIRACRYMYETNLEREKRVFGKNARSEQVVKLNTVIGFYGEKAVNILLQNWGLDTQSSPVTKMASGVAYRDRKYDIAAYKPGKGQTVRIEVKTSNNKYYPIVPLTDSQLESIKSSFKYSDILVHLTWSECEQPWRYDFRPVFMLNSPSPAEFETVISERVSNYWFSPHRLNLNLARKKSWYTSLID